ncbi:unnamed protein product [Protopolystoma xenopodis]|uniref:Uncharacterized protein n=1 Tax=Protopolystoma xenopodis TaxID=117903 RepID=A0A448WJU0_9PLAT|nr:unnamed protein product [Protopolystoma xenopodis]
MSHLDPHSSSLLCDAQLVSTCLALTQPALIRFPRRYQIRLDKSCLALIRIPHQNAVFLGQTRPQLTRCPALSADPTATHLFLLLAYNQRTLSIYLLSLRRALSLSLSLSACVNAVCCLVRQVQRVHLQAGLDDNQSLSTLSIRESTSAVLDSSIRQDDLASASPPSTASALMPRRST